MRVTVDRGVDAVRLELGEAAEARRVDVAEGVVVAYDAAGRILGVEVRGVDPAALHEFAVELAGLADRPAGMASSFPAPPYPASPRAARPPAEPQTPRYEGPLTWEREAEAAMAQIPFFNRGRHRLAASELARRRGQDRVTVDLVQEAGRRAPRSPRG